MVNVNVREFIRRLKCILRARAVNASWSGYFCLNLERDKLKILVWFLLFCLKKSLASAEKKEKIYDSAQTRHKSSMKMHAFECKTIENLHV